MSRRRGASGLSGILLVDKPAGCTSHDVVDRVRRASGERRVGHAGTLDPMATGLLVVLVGPATRLAPYLTAAEKRYEATIVFGAATDTDDREGEVVAEAAVPPDVFEPARAQSLLDGVLGKSMQMPPAYSAIKVDGQVAHRAARGGEALALEPRPIHVHEASLLGINAEAGEWRVDFTVSKGTYVRALARDLGERAGTLAHLGALRRTASGRFDVAAAHSLDAVTAAGAEGLPALFADPAEAFSAMPRVSADAALVLSGRPLPAPDGAADGELVTVFVDGGLGGLYRVSAERLLAEVVMAVPVTGGSAS